jgi:hypothetical protein
MSGKIPIGKGLLTITRQQYSGELRLRFADLWPELVLDGSEA